MELLTASDAHSLVLQAGITISIDSIRDYADNGKLPCLRTRGGIRLFHLKDVEKFIEDRKAQTNSATSKTALFAA